MQQTLDPHRTLTVVATTRTQRDERLEAAVNSLTAAATQLRTGILVTRRSPGNFTVAVSPLVPFGLTREADQLLAR